MAAAPTRASPLPSRGDEPLAALPSVGLPMVMMAAPTTATAMAAQVRAGGRRPASAHPAAIISGAVVTSVTDAATDVSSSEASQAEKWTARAIPAMAMADRWLRAGRAPAGTGPVVRATRRTAAGARISAPPKVRQKARVSAGASAHRTSTAEDEMARTATPASATVDRHDDIGPTVPADRLAACRAACAGAGSGRRHLPIDVGLSARAGDHGSREHTTAVRTTSAGDHGRRSREPLRRGQAAGSGRPEPEAFLDLSIIDARRAGFGEVVLIVRSDIEDDVRGHIDEQHGTSAPVCYIRQDDLGPPRDKPWGHPPRGVERGRGARPALRRHQRRRLLRAPHVRHRGRAVGRPGAGAGDERGVRAGPHGPAVRLGDPSGDRGRRRAPDPHRRDRLPAPTRRGVLGGRRRRSGRHGRCR